MKNILVVGANGMLGHDLIKLFSQKGYNAVGATRKEFDITKVDEIEQFFKNKEFDLVINSAAYTQVDKAEEEQDVAFAINEEGARNLAKITNKRNIPIVYVSTDYVFDGKKSSPYEVCDITNPLNIYGKSKLYGERATAKENDKHYIVRTSWLYGRNGKNFVDTMIDISKGRKEIQVVNDQIGCPTWTLDLSEGIEKLFSEEKEYGTYFICSDKGVSWYDFAKEIFRIKKIDISVIPVSSEVFVRPAKRPTYSVMKSFFAKEWNKSLGSFISSE